MQAAFLAALDDNPNATDQLRRLWIASRGICWRCKRPVKLSKASSDHVIPRARGGTNDPRNLRLAHKRCNGTAGDAMPTEPPPLIPLDGLKSYHGTKSELRNGITYVIRRYGDRCWLCGKGPLRLAEATRVRVRMEPGYSFGIHNVRPAHSECQVKRMRTREIANTYRRRSCTRTRLAHRRRVVVLRRRYAPEFRNRWTRFRAIVCALFSWLRPRRRHHATP